MRIVLVINYVYQGFLYPSGRQAAASRTVYPSVTAQHLMGPGAASPALEVVGFRWFEGSPVGRIQA